MSLPWYEDIEFVKRLPLKNFKQKGNGYVCFCEWCKEGKSPWKSRCNIVAPNTYHSHWTVHCFNCGMTTNVRGLISHISPFIFESYVQREKELFLDGLRDGSIISKYKNSALVDNQLPPTIDIPEFANKTRESTLKYQFELNTRYFKPAREYKAAVEFCKRRNVIDSIDRLYYNIHPDRPESGMVIFPFETSSGLIYGWQGRHPKEKRFHTFSKNEGFKVFGLFQCDPSESVIVAESIIDSLNINNAIACVGAELSPLVIQNFLQKEKLIFALDRDSRGLETATKYCAGGYRVFVWPESAAVKDFNELSCAGWSAADITEFIIRNSYSGLELTTKLGFLKMKKRI
jgi:hypothetical protein